MICKAHLKVKHGVAICAYISKACFNDEKRLMGRVAVCNNIIVLYNINDHHNKNY